MSDSRLRKAVIAALCLFLFATLSWTVYLLFQNWMWKDQAIHYAEIDATMEANSLFRKGYYSLYKMDGKCDEAHFSGQYDGPFQIWIAFYQPSLGAAHRIVTEHWVEAYNVQMRRLQAEPEKFRKRMGLEPVLNFL